MAPTCGRSSSTDPSLEAGGTVCRGDDQRRSYAVPERRHQRDDQPLRGLGERHPLPGCGLPGLPGHQARDRGGDARQHGRAGIAAYQELQTDLVDPDVTPVVDDVPGGGARRAPSRRSTSRTRPATNRTPAPHRRPPDPQHSRRLLRRRQDGRYAGRAGPDVHRPAEARPCLPAGPAASLRLFDGRRARGRARNDKGLQIRHSAIYGLHLLAERRRRRAEPEDPQVGHATDPG